MAISDRRRWGDERLDSWVEHLCSLVDPNAQVPPLMVQVREKDLDDGPLLDLVRRVREKLPPMIPVLVNDRVQVALAAGVEGVHLSSRGLPLTAIRRRWGGRLILGRATHRLEEIAEAAAAGANYVTFSPIFETTSKPGASGVGLEVLGAAAGRAVRSSRPADAGPLAVFALGGVNAPRLASVADAGALGAAGIGLFAPPSMLTSEEDCITNVEELRMAAACFQPVLQGLSGPRAADPGEEVG
ncbi:MAG: thiamine phosphate synthase [Acidobacteriota bacterium]